MGAVEGFWFLVVSNEPDQESFQNRELSQTKDFYKRTKGLHWPVFYLTKVWDKVSNSDISYTERIYTCTHNIINTIFGTLIRE